MFKLKLFLASLALTTGVLLIFIYAGRTRQPAPAPPMAAPTLNQVNGAVFVTSQLRPENVSQLRDQGINKIVDIRPDGEASDQAPSSQIREKAEQLGLAFDYIPVPHGSIPEEAVTRLHNALSDPRIHAVLYCRSGNRAVRTYALVEASRPDGPSADAILQMVHDAGFIADDLKENIDQRITHRSQAQTANQ